MMITINMNASTHICLLNDFVRLSILSIFSFAELSPEAIKALEQTRQTAESARVKDFGYLLLATKLVAVGVVLEGPELVHDAWSMIARWLKRKTSDHTPSWITVVGIIGWLIVSIGVAGEFWVDEWVNSDDEKVRIVDEQLLQDAQSSASRAAAAAAKAKTASDEAVTKSGEANTTAEGASLKADSVDKETAVLEHRLADLNGDVEAQEPRAKLLAKSEAEILEKLSPFAGQKVAVESCGLVAAPGRDRREVFDTWGELIHLLSKSKWKHEIDAPVAWAACDEMPGVTIWANPYGEVDTINASKALGEALSSVLPTRRGVDRPVLIGSGIPMDDPQAPWVWTSKHPDFIVLLVSEQPQAESTPTATKK
jgi:hypothetical protein